MTAITHCNVCKKPYGDTCQCDSIDDCIKIVQEIIIDGIKKGYEYKTILDSIVPALTGLKYKKREKRVKRT